MQVPVKETPWEGPFPDIPNWSENFCLAGFDPVSGVGLWFHIGRWRRDLTMFREMVIIRLPDGSVISHRAIGNALAARDGPGGPHLAVRVVESGHRLTYHFRGGVMRVPARVMLDDIVGDGLRVPLTFDLEFSSNADIWDLHKVGSLQDFLPAGHIEQPGRLTGEIRVGTEVYAFDAMANRDHSLGARDNIDLHSHQWLQGYFENGVSFMLFDGRTAKDGKIVFSEAIVYEGDTGFPARIAHIERCEHVSDDERPIRTVLEYANGKLEIDTVAYRGSSYISLSSPNDQYVGVYKDDRGTVMACDEQSVMLRLNGNIAGYGCYERTIPGLKRREE